jgi:hypothetical protein
MKLANISMEKLNLSIQLDRKMSIFREANGSIRIYKVCIGKKLRRNIG